MYNCNTSSKLILILLLGIIACLWQACATDEQKNDWQFESIASSHSQITFQNRIEESDSVNFYTNEYMYIGSGVGIGDFNNDGLQDIFFAGSQSPCRLYINLGDFRFDDITQEAGFPPTSWCTGVSVIDINADGLQDIYVCVSHHSDPLKRKNLLFVNQGNLRFKEQAEAYGLADTGFSTQATFLDYDHDGDLDMYLLNHQLFNPQPNKLIPPDSSGNAPAADKLYRNEGLVHNHPFFKDVSKEAGILEDGYGLGVVVTDVNKDTYPDIYVANDYLSNDKLWLNQQNGTFKNVADLATRHQSYNSMGVDAGDLNNDLLPDLMVLDMLPAVNKRKKMMALGFSPEKYDLQRRLGYQPEFSRNMLQLHQGIEKIGVQPIPIYSEIGNYAGVAETDWSWSVLMADFDNDTYKDLHITNGLAKDLTNNDFLFFTQEAQQSNYAFGGGSNSLNRFDASAIKALREKLDSYGVVSLNNVCYRNQGNMQFEDISTSVGITEKSISHGAAYADFDNDGDLDLVVNNVNQEAFLLKNTLRQHISDSTHHFLTLQLKGTAQNPNALGTQVYVYTQGKVQLVEQNPVRGYASSVDIRLHIGLGNASVIDSLLIVWPNGTVQRLAQLPCNQYLTVNYQPNAKYLAPTFASFTTQNRSDIPAFTHQEIPFFDYYNRRLQPQKYSQLGPCIAVADVNADGLEDYFVGGAAGQTSKIYLQKANGQWQERSLNSRFSGDNLAASFLDADQDHDLDLVVVGGSTEYAQGTASPVQFFTNDGQGNFTQNITTMPNVSVCAATLATADYDGDGDTDIFVGGRFHPEQFPSNPPSFLFINEKGKFINKTALLAPQLQKVGMVTAAQWLDFDNDQQLDLVLCGEWMPIQFFKNQNGRLQVVQQASELSTQNGLWRSLTSADIDHDGDLDLLAGNIGQNQKYHISAEKPLHLFAKDIDKNGSIELLPAYFIRNETGEYQLFPDFDRNQFAEQTPTIKKKYVSHEEFAESSMNTILTHIEKDNLFDLTCQFAASVWLENQGNGTFKTHLLPWQAQLAPINAILCYDWQQDGFPEIFIAGNEYQTEITTGRYDALYGQILANEQGKLRAYPLGYQGFFFRGDTKAMALLKQPKHTSLLVGNNNLPLKAFTLP